MTQTQSILNHLQAGQSITPIEALERYGCFRLGARIWEIRHKLGFDVVKETIETSGGAKVARYTLKQKPTQQKLFTNQQQPMA